MSSVGTWAVSDLVPDRIGKVFLMLGLGVSGKQGRCLGLCGSRAELHGRGGASGELSGAWGGLVCAEELEHPSRMDEPPSNRRFEILQVVLHLEQNPCLPLFKNSFIIAGLARG